MRNRLALVGMAVASLAWGGDVSFTAKPTAVKDGDRIQIAFAVAAPTDVEVAVLDADGRVIRHLAAGVLGGKNPPPAPLQPGLAQKIVWDGQDDSGCPVSGVKGKSEGAAPSTLDTRHLSPFKVRVRLGLGVRVGRMIGDSPYNFNTMICRGLLTDPKSGDLYLLINNQDPATMRYALRVYDRDGNYLREILPYPATLDAKSREIFGSVTVPGLPAPAPRYYNSYPVMYPFELSKFDPEQESTAMVWRQFNLAALQPADGNVLLLSDHLRAFYRIRQRDGGAVAQPFAEPLCPEGTRMTGIYDCPVGPVTAALALDGRTLYVTAFCLATEKTNSVHEVWPEGRVYKTELGKADLHKFVDVPIPAERPVLRKILGGPGFGNQALHGLLVDKAGRVFVCDSPGNKIWIYTPAGEPAGSLSVTNAYSCALDEKTGALYVLTCRPAPHARCYKSLVKLSGCGPDARVLDTLTFPERYGSAAPFLAADFSGPAPRLWVWGCPGINSLARIEEQDGKFMIVEDLAERGKMASGFAAHVDVDPEKDLVYIRQSALTLRYDGLSGAYAGQLDGANRPKPIDAAELCVRRDGVVYLSGNSYGGGGWAGGWRRLNRDLSPLPWPNGKKEVGFRTGKRHPLPLWWGIQGACVTPDGRVYANAMPGRRFSSVFEMMPDGTAGRCPRMQDYFAGASNGYTQAGYTGLLLGPLQDETGGVKVDRQGNLYVGIRVSPPDGEMPPDFAELDKLGAKYSVPYDRTLGCVIRFKPTGGALWPQGAKPGGYHKPVFFDGNPGIKIPDKLEDGLAMGKALKMEKAFLEGATKAYPGLTGFSSSCRCKTPRFDIDEYGRVYVPNPLIGSVQVYDNEGNPIVRFGSYGNHDSQGPTSRIPEPDIPLLFPLGIAVSFRHIYVADEINRRVVRVDPTWKAEETCEPK